jgi:hypothetical protein
VKVMLRDHKDQQVAWEHDGVVAAAGRLHQRVAEEYHANTG